MHDEPAGGVTASLLHVFEKMLKAFTLIHVCPVRPLPLASTTILKHRNHVLDDAFRTMSIELHPVQGPKEL